MTGYSGNSGDMDSFRMRATSASPSPHYTTGGIMDFLTHTFDDVEENPMEENPMVVSPSQSGADYGITYDPALPNPPKYTKHPTCPHDIRPGDIVECISINTMSGHNDGLGNLRLGTRYYIREINPSSFKLHLGYVEDTTTTANNNWQHWDRFRVVVRPGQPPVAQGDTPMPQVIPTCDIGDAERAIFQQMANSLSLDVYVYNPKPSYFRMEPLPTSGFHIVFNAIRATAGVPIGTPVQYMTGENNSHFTYSLFGKSYPFRIPRLSSNIIATENQYGNRVVYVAADLLTPQKNEENEYVRLLFLVHIATNYGRTPTLKIKDSLGLFMKLKSRESLMALKSGHEAVINQLQANIREYEQRLVEVHVELRDKLLETFDENSDRCNVKVIENIEKMPKIKSVETEIRSGILTFVIKTHPLILSLPHGDVPMGAITINIIWSYSPQVIVNGEWRTNNFHPHHTAQPCWGAAANLIQRLLGACEFDTLVEIILQWHGLYDGSGVLIGLGDCLIQEEIGIVINELNYMAGENEDE